LAFGTGTIVCRLTLLYLLLLGGIFSDSPLLQFFCIRFSRFRVITYGELRSSASIVPCGLLFQFDAAALCG
jgi:hypothetical protein